jgi:hypothetical protein
MTAGLVRCLEFGAQRSGLCRGCAGAFGWGDGWRCWAVVLEGQQATVVDDFVFDLAVEQGAGIELGERGAAVFEHGIRIGADVGHDRADRREARRGEPLHLVGGEFEVAGAEVFFGLLDGASGEDRHRDDRLLHEPTERNLDRGAADFVGDLHDFIHDRQVAGGHGVPVMTLGGGNFIGETIEFAGLLCAAIVFAGGHAACERRPGDETDVHFVGHRQEFGFAGSLNDAVFELGGDERRFALEVGHGVGLGDPPGGEVGSADVVDFALASEVIETAEDFIDGRREIVDVNPEQIDVLGVHPLEAGFNRTHHVLAMVAAAVGVGSVNAAIHQGVFRGNNDSVAVTLDEFSQVLFGLAFLVAVGGIDEVAAGRHVGVEDAPALFFVGTDGAPIDAESRAAEAEFGDAEAAAA